MLVTALSYSARCVTAFVQRLVDRALRRWPFAQKVAVNCMSRIARCCLAVGLALFLFSSAQAIGHGKRVLALLEDTAIKSTHSLFFNSLTSRGYQITYSAANAPELDIKDWDVYLYDKIIVFASNTPGKSLQQRPAQRYMACQPSVTLILYCRVWRVCRCYCPA